MLFFQKNSSFKKTPWGALESLVSFSTSLSPHFGVQFLLALYVVHSMHRDREWAHCFVVTGTQLLWDFRFCLWTNLRLILFCFSAKSSVFRGCGVFHKIQQSSSSSSSSVPCFSAHLLIVYAFLSCTSLRHGSVSQLSGGGRGRALAPECSLIGWFGKFGWFSCSLSFAPSSFFFFLLGFFQLPS